MASSAARAPHPRHRVLPRRMANEQPQPLSDQCRTRLTLDLDLVAGADQYASLATLAQVRERTAQPDAGVSLDRLQPADPMRSEEHTSELQSLMRISYAVFCLQKKTIDSTTH